MQEMVELSKTHYLNPITQVQAVYYINDVKTQQLQILMAGPSHFSPELTGDKSVSQKAVFVEPFRLCSSNCFIAKFFPLYFFGIKSFLFF